jgi:hypothetical protein
MSESQGKGLTQMPRLVLGSRKASPQGLQRRLELVPSGADEGSHVR